MHSFKEAAAAEALSERAAQTTSKTHTSSCGSLQQQASSHYKDKYERLIGKQAGKQTADTTADTVRSYGLGRYAP